MMQWETVIGLEVHVQLSTQSKIFSGAGTEFGAEPNTQACAVDLALPGTLPVLNEQALRYAVMFGLKIDAEISPVTVFERKNYFYPDLPKGYQTSQMDKPIVGAGTVDIELPDGTRKTIRIHHAHLEEDAGKSLHEDFHGYTGIDLNRAGTPLIEIVTEPDMRSADEAVALARKLHEIVVDLQICDGDMSQGSMRFDVNISVRKKGSAKLGTRTETKNLNSFRFMEEAIELEVERQIDVLESGGQIIQETRLYDGDTKSARSMRTKEEANDYRYFPCPDLLPIKITQDFINEVRKTIPAGRQDRAISLQGIAIAINQGTGTLTEQATRTVRINNEEFELKKVGYGLSEYEANLISEDADLTLWYEVISQVSGEPALTASWMLNDLLAKIKRENSSISECPIPASYLAEIVKLLASKTISKAQSKQLLDKVWGRDVAIPITGVGAQSATGVIGVIVEELGLKQVSDTGALEKLVDDVLAQFPEQVEQYRAADESKRKKLAGFFVGPIMKASKGQANPGLVNQILMKKLSG